MGSFRHLLLRPAASLVGIIALFSYGGCGPESSQLTLCLSELMVRPRGPRRGYQWVELYNAGPTAVSLAPYELCFEGPRRTVRRRLGRDTLLPGGRMVVGQAHAPCEHAALCSRRLPLLSPAGTLLLSRRRRAVDAWSWQQEAPCMQKPGSTTHPVLGHSAVRPPAGPVYVASAPLYDGRNRGAPGRPKPPPGACWDPTLGEASQVDAWRPVRPFSTDRQGEGATLFAVSPRRGIDALPPFFVVAAGSKGGDCASLSLVADSKKPARAGRRTWLLADGQCGYLAPYARKLFVVALTAGARAEAFDATPLKGPLPFRTAALYRLIDDAQQRVLDAALVPRQRPGELWWRPGAPVSSASPFVAGGPYVVLGTP